MAGMHHMKYGKFLFYNVTSGFLWSTLYILIGFFFSEQAKAIIGWINNTSYLIVGVVVIGGVALYVWKRYAYKKLMEEETAEITNKL
jgi:membrane protein DedA with SNARE-associated domain